MLLHISMGFWFVCLGFFFACVQKGYSWSADLACSCFTEEGTEKLRNCPSETVQNAF